MTAVLALSGCETAGPAADAGGGAIPVRQAFVEYRQADDRYSIKVPEGWARTESAGAATFADKLHTIIVALGTRAVAPDLASGERDLVALRATTPGYTAGTASVVDRPAGPVVLITYRAAAPADPASGKVVNDDVERYQFWRDAALLTVTLAGPHGADNAGAWRTVTDSVRWLP